MPKDMLKAGRNIPRAGRLLTLWTTNGTQLVGAHRWANKAAFNCDTLLHISRIRIKTGLKILPFKLQRSTVGILSYLSELRPPCGISLPYVLRHARATVQRLRSSCSISQCIMPRFPSYRACAYGRADGTGTLGPRRKNG